jgi:diaminopropionate ammonia-lyase
VINPAYDPSAIPTPALDALPFHRALPGYAPTPVRELRPGVWVKDESNRLGLPAF